MRIVAASMIVAITRSFLDQRGQLRTAKPKVRFTSTAPVAREDELHDVERIASGGLPQDAGRLDHVEDDDRCRTLSVCVVSTRILNLPERAATRS